MDPEIPMLIAGFLLWAVGIVVLIVGIAQFRTVKELAQGCTEPVEARVIGCDEEFAARVNRTNVTGWYPTFEYERDGDTVKIHSKLCTSKRNRFEVGETVELLVNPSNPCKYEILDGRIFDGKRWIRPGIAMLTVGTLLLMPFWTMIADCIAYL